MPGAFAGAPYPVPILLRGDGRCDVVARIAEGDDELCLRQELMKVSEYPCQQRVFEHKEFWVAEERMGHFQEANGFGGAEFV